MAASIDHPTNRLRRHIIAVARAGAPFATPRSRRYISTSKIKVLPTLYSAAALVTYKQFAQRAFASGMISLGVSGFILRDFAGTWQSVPPSIPFRQPLEYACAVLMLVFGIGLLIKRTEALSARVLVGFWALILLLIKIPFVVKQPLVEVNWQSMSEILVIFAGILVLAAASERTRRIAQLVFGFALIPLGLAHFFYLQMTAPIIPSWIPFHTALAYFTGAAQVAAGIAVLLGVLARLAASLDAVLLTLFTVLVWPPMLFAKPTSADAWSELISSWAVTAGAWVVAESIAKKRRTVDAAR
jgi:uncharacterized membrane protein